MENPAAARRILQALRDAGIRISVDDFGTGYSSLSYLTQFPLTALKIDRSFVRDVNTDPNAASIARAIIDMARSLGFITIAEGVEDGRQASFLRQFGCDQAQGFLFAPPLSPEQAALKLRGQAPQALPAP
jgi:EAL domain-containing protein (putative c-di-GMP-specific phosphodiesterase class I)